MKEGSTSTIVFKNFNDLENFINKSKNPQKETQSSKKEKTIQPDDTRQKVIEDMVNEVKQKMAQKTDLLNSPTYFKKPVFFLDQLSPILEATLVFRYNTSDNPKKPYEERRLKLFASSGEETNANHLTYFKYTPIMAASGGGQSQPSVELKFIDIKNEILDYLAYQLSVIGRKDNIIANEPQNPIIEIKYGWYHNENFVPDGIQDYDKIMFTNKFIAIITKVVPSYNSIGVPEVTIHGTIESDEIVFRGTKPWDLFGTMPAVALSLKEMFAIMDDVFNAIKKDQNKLIAGLGFIAYMIDIRGCKDDNVVIEVLKSAVLYYEKILNIKFKITDSTYKLFIGNKTKYANFQKKKNYLPLILGITTETGKFVGVDSSKGSASGTTGTVKGGLGQQSSKNISNDSLKTFYQELYHITFRNMIDAEINDSKKLFTDLFSKLGTVINNTFKIHPYIVMRYFQNVMKTMLNDFDKQDTQYFELYDYLINPTTLMPTEVNFLSPDYYPDFYTKTDKSILEYYSNVKDYLIELNTTWNSLFQNIFSKMYVRYDINKDNLSSFTGTIQKESIQTQTVGGKKISYVPLRLNSSIITCDYESAEKNLKLFIYALEQRLNFIKMNTKGSKVASYSEKSTEENLATARSKLAKIKKGSMHLLHFIAISGDPKDVFMVNLGKQTIAQAYSLRVNNLGGTKDQFFSVGEPNVYNINVMDIQGLQFDFDYWNDMQGLAANARLIGGHRRGTTAVNNYVKLKVKELLKQAEEIAKRNSNDISQLEQIRNKILAIDPQSNITNAVGPARDSTFPINVTITEYQNSRIYGGDLYNALEKKRAIQNIRNMLILQGRNINCTLTILGDPTFNFPNITNYKVFLKVINQDNTLSFFTGIYWIFGVTHEISAGKFITTLYLRIDTGQNISSTEKEQLRKLIYASDRQKPTFDF